MANCTHIFLPLFPKTRDVFFKGYVTVTNNLTEIFITKYCTNYSLIESINREKDTIYGQYTVKANKSKQDNIYNNYLLIEDHGALEVKKCIINGRPISLYDQIIILLYDYNTVYTSEILPDSDDFISRLRYYIQKDSLTPYNVSNYYPIYHCPSWIETSMFMIHIFNYINLISWLLTAAKRRDKISIQHGNLILAILVDIILGYLILELIIFDQKDVTIIIFGALEKLVALMYSLLKWLMGAPAGLKLNNAFNKMLGKYFLYHVELWWLFLEVSSSKLDVMLDIYQYMGYLGLTFQAAIVSDIIGLVTFHSYCIYVYAARLFSLQISGLIALLRLFVGRKYNPLRGGIDSCQYTNQQLFVGTVAFTIMLLLLPTTLMYYIVFTMFRVLSLLVQYILAKLIYIIQCTPFYVFILWLTQSSKLAGKVFIEELTPLDSPTLVLNVKLLNESIRDLVVKLKPPIDMIKDIDWTVILKNVITGKQII